MASSSSQANQQAPKASDRPVAVQRRGVERVQAILDAAEALLREDGYQAATLKAIGERSGIPTASVYHYFGDRSQVESVLVQRYVSEIDERVTAALDDPKLSTIRDAVDAVIDPLFACCSQNPSFVQLWFVGRSSALSELAHEFEESQAEKLWHFLIERNLVRADTPLFVPQLALEAGDRLFDVAFQRSPTGDDTTIGEARRLVAAYIKTYAAQTQEPDD